MTQTFHCKLDVRHPQQRIFFTCAQLDRVVLGSTFIAAEGTHVVEVELLGLPGQQSFLDLLRKPIGIRRRSKCFAGHNPRSLMVAVTVAIRSLKAGHQHVWPERSNHSHNVRQCDVMPLPLLKRFVRALRKTEVRDPSEALLHSVVAIRRSQLECAQNPQHVKEIAAHLILPAFATVEGQQQHGIAPGTRFQGHHPAIFVIRMSRGVHQASRSAEAPQHELQPGTAGVLGKRVERPDFFGIILRRR